MMLYLLAAEGGNPVIPVLVPAITSVVVFVVFYLLLKAMVWPKITKGLDDRADKIRGEIKAAEDARAQAKASQQEYEKSLSEARHEANEMIAKARADALKAGEELKRRNEAELSEMKQRATQDITSAKMTAIKELHAEAATLAAAVAKKIASGQSNDAEQE